MGPRLGVRRLTRIRDAPDPSCTLHSLVKFYGAYYSEGEIGIGLEYMDRGSLASVRPGHAAGGTAPTRSISFLARPPPSRW